MKNIPEYLRISQNISDNIKQYIRIYQNISEYNSIYQKIYIRIYYQNISDNISEYISIYQNILLLSIYHLFRMSTYIDNIKTKVINHE